MNILYIASTCSKEKYAEYVERNGERVSQQAQKYNLLLAEGLVQNGSDVALISSRPINRTVSRKLWFKGEKESVSGLNYVYLSFINYPVFRNVFVLLGTFFRVLFSKTKKKQTVVICDALNIMGTLGALAAAALRGLHTVGIVTDVPCHLSNMDKIPFYQKLNLWIMRRFKSYLLLTKPMNSIVNPKGRPYIVLEGHSDNAMVNTTNELDKKVSPRVCLYAGSLKKIYGIKSLVEGFVAAKLADTQLHIYGDGDYVQDLKQLVQQYDAVKYLGIAPNHEVVQAQMTATLLINPRPTHEEYTKYSFPSKNMEYMASGTPVLTTRLPGMPKDHEPYVYFIENETAEGIAAALKNVLTQTPEELHEFGNKAKQFVLTEKSNSSQAGKVLSFIETNLA